MSLPITAVGPLKVSTNPILTEPCARAGPSANEAVYCRVMLKQAGRIWLSIAHEVSGLGSTRVVRFSVPKGSGDDGTGTVATGPENAEVQGRFEPLGAAGAVGNGRGGDSGGVGAAISALPAALRGRRAPRAAGQAPGQGLGQAGAGRRDRMDARRVPDRI